MNHRAPILLNLLLVLAIAMPLAGVAQITELQSAEQALLELQTRVGSAEGDAARMEASKELDEALRKTMKVKGAYQYPFQLLNKVNSMTSPDGAFRIFNWNVALDDGTFQYRLLVWPKGHKKPIEVVDKETLSDNAEQAVYPADNWYGALYYDIRLIKSDGQTLYTLLGWDGNDRLSTKKLLDVLVFDGKKDLHFGAPVFEVAPGEYVNRRVFEYAKEVVMNLRWVDPKDAIVFDKLQPINQGLAGHRTFYGPGTGYSGYTAERGKWVLTENMDMSRPKRHKSDARFNFPDRPDFKSKRDTVNPLIGK